MHHILQRSLTSFFNWMILWRENFLYRVRPEPGPISSGRADWTSQQEGNFPLSRGDTLHSPVFVIDFFFFWSLFKWHLSSIRNWPIAKKSSGQDNHTCWFGHEYLFFQMRFGPFGLLRSLWHHRVTYIISSVRSLADWWVVGLLGHNLLIHTVCPILYS